MGCGSSRNSFVRDGIEYGRDDKKNGKDKERLRNGGIAPVVPESEVAEQYRKTIYDLREQAITQGLMEAEYEWCGRSESDVSSISSIRTAEVNSGSWPQFSEKGYDHCYNYEMEKKRSYKKVESYIYAEVISANYLSPLPSLQEQNKCEVERSLHTNGKRKRHKGWKFRLFKREHVSKGEEKEVQTYTDLESTSSTEIHIKNISVNTTNISSIKLSENSIKSVNKENCFWRDELIAEKKQTKFFNKLKTSKKEHKTVKKIIATTSAEKKENLLTIFLCRQLLNENEIGKGMYSDVYLADMTVIPAVRPSTIQNVLTSITQAECIKNVCDESEACLLEHQICCCQNEHKPEEEIQGLEFEEGKRYDNIINTNGNIRTLQNEGEQIKPNAALTEHNAKCEEQFSENSNYKSTINNKDNVNFIINANSVSQTTRNKTANACPPHRHYLICVREMYLYKYQETPRFINDVVQELSEWQRLNTFNNRLLRCVGAEIVNGDRFTPSKIKWPAVMQKFVEDEEEWEWEFAELRLEREIDHGRLLKSWMSTKEKELIASEAAKNRPNITKSAQRICKLRVYTEFAKHGTLRSFQTREIPKRFGKNYLHELTARALMREVLLGLLQMHESFALLYDLNASNVYVSHPMQAVYKTLFPAYISDIPVGSLFKVNMKYLGNLLLEQQQSKLVKGQRTEKRGRLARDAHHMKNRSEIAVAPLNRSSLGSDLPAKEDHAHKVANNNNNNIANADAVQEQQYVNKDTLLANGQVAESGKENTLGLTENLNLSARQTHELSTAVLDAKNSTVFTSNTELIESNSLMYVNIDDINNDATNVDNNNIKEDDLVSENTVLNEDDDVFWQSAHARKYFTEHGYESDSLFAPSMNNSWPSVTSETKSKQRVSRSAKKGDKKYDRNLHWRAILTHNDHEKVISLKPNDMPLQYSLEELISPSLSPRSKKRFPFSIPRRKKKSKVQKALTNLEHANNVNKTFKPNENPLQGVVFIASQRLPSYFVERPDTTNKANNELSSTLRNNTIKTGKGKATLKSEAQRSDVTHKSTDKQINVNKIALVGGTSSDAATAHKSLNEHQCSKTTTTTTITHNKNDNNNNFKKCESSSYRPHCSLQESCALMETSAEYSTQQYSRRGSKSENCTSLGISRCNELCSLPSYLPLLLEDSTAEANTQKSIVAGKLVQNIIEASKVSTVTGKADALHLGTHPQHLQTHQNEPKREDIQLPMHIREKENVNKSNKHKNKAEVNNAQVTMANLSAPANTAERNNTITSPVEDVLEPSTSEFQFNESIIQGTWRANEHSNSNSSNVHYRHRHPVVKLNYTTLLKRVLARKQNQSDSKTVPLHRFMRITHAAPEVILNRQFSQASDVYAFAMMFIELCTPNGEILPECEPNVNVASPSHTHHTPEVDELVIAGTQNDKEEDQEGKQHQYYNKEQQQHLHMSNINPPNEYVERKEYEEQRAANVKAWYKSQLEQYNKRQKRSMENSSPVYSAMKENNYDSNAIINKIHATKANSTEVAATVAAAPSGIASVLIRPNDSITARGVFASRNTIRKEDAFGTNFDLSAYIVDPDSQNKHSAVNNSNTSNDLFNNNCSSSNYNMYDKSFYSTELNKRGSGASFAGNIDDLFDLDYMQHCLVPIPSHLSSECKRLLARCLHVNPAKRPSVAELLRSPYFLFGHWIQHSAHDIKEYHAKALHDARNELTPELFDEEREHGTQTLSLSLSTEHALHNNSQAKPENMNCIVATSNGNKKNNVIIGERNQNRQTRNAQNDNNNYKSASQIHTVSWVNAPEELDYRRMPEVPWNEDVDYIRIGRAAGLPVIPEKQEVRQHLNLSMH